MKLRTLLVVSTLAAATPAIAGEITGNGELTPVNRYIAKSICSFSGRNDDTSGPSSLVQSYGRIVAAFGQPDPLERPGVSCNGHSGWLS